MDGFDGDKLVEDIMLKYREGLKDELPKQRAIQAREMRNIPTRGRDLIKKLEEGNRAVRSHDKG